MRETQYLLLQILKTQKLVESAQRETRVIKETATRSKKIDNLVKTLNADKASTMRDLLESVQTPRLDGAFEKYLPAVLNNGSTRKSNKKTLTETRKAITGNKVTANAQKKVNKDDTNVIDIQRLAGLKP